MSYYQKYRPQSLSELIGQEVVKQTVSQAFKSGRLSHAYLFVGPRGTGKTSLARILAKMVNCELVNRESLIVNRKDKNDNRYTINDIPCNSCTICISITDGSNLDLIEIDAASNRGIDDIRSLREKIKLAPTTSKKKVYIIDEVHMLTQEAFNALLKTLEEPPKHTLFILATTDISKVPQTIISRCMRLDFKLAKSSELLEVLKNIARSEKIEIDDNALKLLVKKSDGSFRDGVKLLDQVSTNSSKITVGVLENLLKSSSFDDILDLIDCFSKKDTKKALNLILRQIDNEVDVKETVLSLMDTLRNLVFIKNDLEDELVKSHFTEDKYEQLVKVSKGLSNQDLIRTLDILQSSLEKLKFASIPSLPLELAVLEICEDQRSQKKSAESEYQITDKPEISDISVIRHTNLSDTPTSPDSPDIAKLKEKWTFVLETIRPYNFSLEALLRSVRVSECTNAMVVMEVPYSFHQRILEAPKNRDLLEGVLSEVLGRQIKVSCVLGNRPVQKDDIENIEVAQDDEIIRVAAEIFNSDSVN